MPETEPFSQVARDLLIWMDNDSIWSSAAGIAPILGVPVDQVMEALTQLEASGYVEKGHPQGEHLYHLTPKGSSYAADISHSES